MRVCVLCTWQRTYCLLLVLNIRHTSFRHPRPPRHLRDVLGKGLFADAPYICSVGIAGECIIALAAVCLGSEDVGLQSEAARLCASIAAMPNKQALPALVALLLLQSFLL